MRSLYLSFFVIVIKVSSSHTLPARMPPSRSPVASPCYLALGQVTAGLCFFDILVTLVFFLCVRDVWQSQVGCQREVQGGRWKTVCINTWWFNCKNKT
jgi:hypothetical protein